MATATPATGSPSLAAWLRANTTVTPETSTSPAAYAAPVSATTNALFAEDKAKYRDLYATKPWMGDVHYVKRCYISAIAVLKMILHAQTGRQQRGGGGGGSQQQQQQQQGAGGTASSSGAPSSSSAAKDDWVEVMGQFQGHVNDHCVVLTDSFGIPVPATAVECALDDAATNYLVQYNELTERTAGRSARVFGWYHTHPGYTSFLSGTDVATQRLQQMMGGPVVAIVFDPVKTLTSGNVELKAFRTYPENYTLTPKDLAARAALDRACAGQARLLGGVDSSAGLTPSDLSAAIAASSGGNKSGGGAANNKKREMAFYASSYYEVPITIFRSERDAAMLELLWSKYWSKALASSPAVERRAMMTSDLGAVATHLAGGKYALPSAVAAAAAAGGGAPGGRRGVSAFAAADDEDVDNGDASDGGRGGKGARRRPRGGVGGAAGGGGTASSSRGDPFGFSDVLPLTTSVGLDAVQGLLTAHVKRTVFN